MPDQKRIRRRRIIINQLKHKYRLVFFNDNTFEEVWHLRLSAINVLSAIGTISIFMIGLVIALMAYSPLRSLIPGYPDEDMKRKNLINSMRLDSLENQLRIRDQYFANLNALISGQEPVSNQNKPDSTKNYKKIKFSKSINDSMLRQQIEEEEQFNFSVSGSPKQVNNIAQMHFFTPVKGIIINPFNSKENHFGIDIVASPNEVVKSTLDGTITIATWTLETGYNIQIQHANNIISVYKHNANLLKKVGNHVNAGDAIAIVGNTGELSSGPHLHFELWINGSPVNPADYIIFN
jgi:murein DD-endopeptidase MepM/ murein hydrolase activator NlpD